MPSMQRPGRALRESALWACSTVFLVLSLRRTSKSGLRQVDFVVDGEDIRGLEQNPDTKSRWAAMARSGKKVMQFLSRGRYVANVVDGKVTLYTGRTSE